MRKKWVAETKHVVGARPPLPDGVVKSAGRVLRILEYFDEIQRAANVVEIAGILKLPQSSSSALLRSLVAMGYLYFDRAARTYLPSCRVALLGNWVNSPLFVGGTALRCMEELQHKTGDAVVLAIRNGVWSQYIHVLQATSMARLQVTRGALRPLAASGTGYALLGTMEDTEVKKIAHRINAEARTGAIASVATEGLLATLGEVRRLGYAFTADLVTPGGAVLAMPLPVTDSGEALVIGLGGISEVQKKRRAELVVTMRETLAAYFPQ
ncbi:Acetate operon repressor (plasmid) [Variovorax sp. SRS16]|uniref:IclR family transcriptional regulator n=1 Tax=Variovorax sp. SRS16 TaxID=282217 RepID=UPI0013171C95|nr:helix-turn-helix domain-containing protein [Variovorax sp. SRS16]VTU45806.1 Acetate operon repressor [Variovorax sp. SRS16]